MLTAPFLASVFVNPIIDGKLPQYYALAYHADVEFTDITSRLPASSQSMTSPSSTAISSPTISS